MLMAARNSHQSSLANSNMAFSMEIWCTARILLLEQCESLVDYSSLSRVDLGLGHKITAQQAEIILFQDNFSGHVPPDDLTNIQVKNFMPKLTAHVRPADAGIIQCLKVHYCASFMNQAINCYDNGICPAHICDINIFEAMCLANIAWKEVDMTTIHNCWQKTKILPDILFNPTPLTTPAVPVPSLLNNNLKYSMQAAAEELSHSLFHLERISVLQPCN
jgi:hypothetical protein